MAKPKPAKSSGSTKTKASVGTPRFRYKRSRPGMCRHCTVRLPAGRSFCNPKHKLRVELGEGMLTQVEGGTGEIGAAIGAGDPLRYERALGRRKSQAEDVKARRERLMDLAWGPVSFRDQRFKAVVG